MVLIFSGKILLQQNDVTNTANSLIKIFFLIIASAELSKGFNIAEEAHYIASFDSGTGHRRAYFGYAVGLLKSDKKSWLLVGAPRANSTIPQVIEPGSFFKCDVSHKENKCEEVVLDSTMNGYLDDMGTHPFRNHAWTGAALDVDRDGNVAIGAPRWSDSPKKLNEYRTNGLCYILRQDLTSGNATKIPVLLNGAKQLYRHGEHNVYYYTHGEVGMSAHFTDTREQHLLLGAPGVLNWQGSVAQLKPLPASPTGRSNKQIASKVYSSNSATVLNPITTPKIGDSYYFGYSVTSGKFDLRKDFYLVSGAPRGASSYGVALVFEMNEWRFLTKEEKSGTQLGEYFGSSVAAPDLNGDGLSDLVVGAPLHSLLGIGDAGCVYVYINSAIEKEKLAIAPIKLLGDLVQGARFGSALGTPGDLNNDGFQDLLVGAPYENDGAVYVFMGARYGIREPFAQKLTPESVSAKGVRGFGISFSRPVDIDDNMYPDFAIGSYLTDAAIVMKTRPVITVHGSISVSPSKLSATDTRFIATPCLSFSGFGAPAFADITVTVTLSQESGDGRIPAIFSNGNSDIQIAMKVLAGNESTCHKLPVDLVGERTNIQQPISVHLKYKLDANDQEGPAIDPKATLPVPITLSFITGCKNDQECHADLAVEAYFKDFSADDHLLIGNTSKLTLEIKVSNSKDPAFLPNITISYPSSFKRFPSGYSCSSLKGKNWRTVLVCQLRSPLLSTTVETLSFEFDVSALDDTSPDIAIDLQANSAAEVEVNPANNNKSAYLKVKKKARLEFRGSFNPEQYSYHHFDEQTIIANESVKMQSIVVLSKLDVTPLAEVILTVNFPREFDLDGEKMSVLHDFKNELLFHGKRSNCEEKELDLSESQSENRRYSSSGSKLSKLSCSSTLLNCTSVVCRIGPWSKSFDVATLTVNYELNLTALSHLIYVKEGAKLENEIFAEISSMKGHEKQFEGISKIDDSFSMTLIAGTLPPEPLAWWIYFLAILGGFILLMLIAFGLFKLGFFKRKKKQQLEAQKATLLTEGQARQEEN